MNDARQCLPQGDAAFPVKVTPFVCDARERCHLIFLYCQLDNNCKYPTITG